MTPYATVWGKRKMSIPTKKPILKMDYSISKSLPFGVRQSTAFDALSHAIESFWSKDATLQSKKYSKKAIRLIINYFKGKKDINALIAAGNLSGQAIIITKTNVVHAISYPITIQYGIDHGTACGMVLPYIVAYMDFGGLPRLFNLKSNKELVALLKKAFITPRIMEFDAKLIANRAMEYGKIKDGPKRIDKKSLVRILRNVKEKKWISIT